MSDGDVGEWRPFVLWLVAALLIFSFPYPFYWWSLSSGALPAAAEWYGAGNNHGPWRWTWQGWWFVQFPLWSLLLGAPAAIGDGFRRAWISAKPVFALVGFAIAAVNLALLWIHAKTLIWTID